jgi:hypothetical protein
MKYNSILIIFLLISCSTPIKQDNQETPSTQPIPQKLKVFLLTTTNIQYYELPDTEMVTNPEELLTFSNPVRNPSHLQKLRQITTNSQLQYSSSPPKSCKPSYNSALVYTGDTEKQTILFSINCSLLFFYQERLYLDIGNQTMVIEDIFRKIRSGR